MRPFVRQTTKSTVLPTTKKPVTLETLQKEVAGQEIVDISRKVFILVAKYVGGYKNHPSFSYIVPGYNLHFKLKAGSQEYYLSTGTLDSYNRIQESATYTFGCGGCGKRCTVAFKAYPKSIDGTLDISKPELLTI